jgi:poly-gamma-glutamate synthesis protein (capsule biosynthesis protein)
VSALLDMGVDVASLANNHALDYGQDALLDTFSTLDNAGIPYVGAGETKERAEEAVFVEAGGRKVGVLSASRVIPVVEWNIQNCQPGLFCTYDSTRLVQRIKEIENQCDYVVVFVHWGLERKTHPEEYQRVLAQQYIDAGADLVVGNHSHVPQGIEYYKGVPIVYCLGNYIFNPNMTDTYALKVVWDAQGQTNLQVLPVDTREYLTGELTGDEAQAFYDYLEEISFDVEIDENGMVKCR